MFSCQIAMSEYNFNRIYIISLSRAWGEMVRKNSFAYLVMVAVRLLILGAPVEGDCSSATKKAPKRIAWTFARWNYYSPYFESTQKYC